MQPSEVILFSMLFTSSMPHVYCYRTDHETENNRDTVDRPLELPEIVDILTHLLMLFLDPVDIGHQGTQLLADIAKRRQDLIMSGFSRCQDASPQKTAYVPGSIQRG